MTFRSEVEAWSRKTARMLDAVPRKVAIDLSSDLIFGTPVDTGRAKGNWHFSAGSPVIMELDVLDPAGGSTFNEIVAQVSSAPLGVWWISNNLAYIEELEMGHSQQAPQGWVRAAVIRAQANVQRAANANVQITMGAA